MKKMIKFFISLSDEIYNSITFLRRKPVFIGCKPQVQGKIYIVSDKGAITFGDRVCINSSMQSDPIGGTNRTILFAEPDAKICIGHGVGISNTAIHAAKSVYIGDNVLIGGDCRIYDTDFHSVLYEERMQNTGVKSAPVVIGAGAFIGAGSMILKGVHIGKKSVIAAGSVVTKDIPEKQVWGGHQQSSSEISPLKVCHILNSLLPSGAETMLVTSQHLWTGWEKHIIVTERNIGVYADTLRSAGYIIHHISEDNFISQHKAVGKFLKELQPDVVHIHRESQDCYYALDAKQAGVRHIVRTVHNVFDFKGELRVRRIVTRAFARILGTRYVAIGQSVYENEKKIFYNTPHCIIDNWCNESRFRFISEEIKVSARKAAGISEKTMVLISIGNCSQVKNHMLIFKAVNRLVSEEKSDILYYHIGEGNEIEHEKEYVKEKRLEKYVRFMGHTDPAEYLKLADLNIMPSTYEGVGISAMEAMFCGIPCLLTDVAGLKDFKTLNSTAIYYSDLGETEFYHKLRELWLCFGSGKIVNSLDLSVAARHKYNMEKSVHKYMEVYRQ